MLLLVFLLYYNTLQYNNCITFYSILLLLVLFVTLIVIYVCICWFDLFRNSTRLSLSKLSLNEFYIWINVICIEICILYVCAKEDYRKMKDCEKKNISVNNVLCCVCGQQLGGTISHQVHVGCSSLSEGALHACWSGIHGMGDTVQE